MDDFKPLPKSPILPSAMDPDGKNLLKALFDHVLNSNQRVNQLQDVVRELQTRVKALEDGLP